MTLFEHLAELRHRFIISGIATVLGMVIAAVFLTWPIVALLTPDGVTLQALRPTETFTVYFQIALVVGAGLAMPIILWQALLFVLPALHKHERKWVYIGVPAATVAFVIGIMFGFFVVTPTAVRFLGGFGGGVVENNWSLEYYLTFVSTFLFWVGVSFETPIVVFALVKMGVITVKQLGGLRRYALLGAFVLGAIITPTPDLFNQAIVAIPICLLYELGILCARFA